ncbi:DUF2511 domain-containing protein [Kitasatospora sp. MAA19]|uniref:DUF2511 domain-containing protein n=1 Tax=Kitasatospora sp. MAA19 TaxID=3035090 RepID=UPI002474C4F7|nr:DUF2511 domain-containing protein [Kitasatospora sp. MAA19]
MMAVEFQKPGADRPPWHRDWRLAAGVVGGGVLLIAAWSAAFGGGSTKGVDLSPGERAVSRADVVPWPFSAESGMLRCRTRSGVTFQPSGGVEYALNGSAQTMGYPKVDPIWRLDPGLGNGLKVDISAAITAGQALC